MVVMLDGLRAVAILTVVADHLYYLPGGFIGVTVFFVISGFLITSLLLRERVATGRINYRAFYVRRIARLYPALILALAISAVLSVLDGGDPAAITVGALIAGLYLMNLVVTFTNQWLPFAFHTWTLAQEEQFYLVAPRFIAAVPLDGLRRWGLRLLVAAGVLGALRIVLLVALPAGHVSLYENPILNTDALAAGVGAAFLLGSRALPSWLRRITTSNWTLLACLFVFAALTIASRPENWTMGVGITGTLIVTLLCVFHITERPDSIASRILSWRPLRWIGVRSYGVYLFHVEVINRAEALLAPQTTAARVLLIVVVLAAALFIAALSYRFVEQPLRRRIARLA